MKNNIWKSLTNNFGYKILALLFAFSLWVVVYNIDDPLKTGTVTLNVTVTNTSYLDNMNKYYEIIEGTNRVTISVVAPRSMWEDLDETDFTAVADLSNISIDETGMRGTVPIEITCKKTSDSIKINTTGKLCKIALENLMSQQFVIAANANGTVADGHALGRVEVTSPTVLKVSGPESIVQTISKVVASIDVEGMSMDLKDNVVPVLYDTDGNKIDTTRLKFSNSTVTVSAEILKIKEVPISVKTDGTPATGYVMTAIASSPTTVEIKGDSAVLNTVSAIEIPTNLVNISGATEDVKAIIDISEYLPEGTELVDNSQANVEITVSIEAVKSKNLSIDTNHIIVTGLADGLKLEYTNTNENITVYALKEDLDMLTENAVSVSIDLNNLTAGTHQVPLKVEVDDAKYFYSERTITVVISEIPAEPTEPAEPAEPTDPSESTEATDPSEE